MNLVLLDPSEIGPDGVARLADRRATHIREVLKAAPGQAIRVGVLNGPRGTATVQELTEAGVSLRCTLEAEPPPRPSVDLLLALPRPKVMRRLWAQLAAVGVGRVILTNARKVERVYFDTHVLRPETYRPLLVEGLQQSQDTHLPEVSIHRQFKVLIEDELDAMCPEGGRLLADPGAAHRITDLIVPGRGIRVLLAVGPEGGWTDFERDLLQEHGFLPVTMGARTLRSDTACIALLALVHDLIAGRRRPA
ncbi:MAG: RsmE family RNA methyltransferase [Verrucomicrobiota bacterium]